MSIGKAKMKPLFDFIPEKPTQLFSLEVRSRLITTRNQDIIDNVTSPESLGIAPCEDILISINYDQNILGQLNLTNGTNKTWSLKDDKEQTDHEISLWLQGKKDGHTLMLQDQITTVCAEIDVFIESVKVTDLITGGGRLILGENDKKITLSITTPIYRWLLSHYDTLYKKLQSQQLWSDLRTRL